MSFSKQLEVCSDDPVNMSVLASWKIHKNFVSWSVLYFGQQKGAHFARHLLVKITFLPF